MSKFIKAEEGFKMVIDAIKEWLNTKIPAEITTQLTDKEASGSFDGCSIYVAKKDLVYTPDYAVSSKNNIFLPNNKILLVGDLIVSPNSGDIGQIKSIDGEEAEILGSVQKIGNIRGAQGFQGKSITNAEFTTDNKLKLTFTDPSKTEGSQVSEITLDKSLQGRGINILYIENGKLIVKYNKEDGKVSEPAEVGDLTINKITNDITNATIAASGQADGFNQLENTTPTGIVKQLNKNTTTLSDLVTFSTAPRRVWVDSQNSTIKNLANSLYRNKLTICGMIEFNPIVSGFGILRCYFHVVENNLSEPIEFPIDLSDVFPVLGIESLTEPSYCSIHPDSNLVQTHDSQNLSEMCRLYSDNKISFGRHYVSENIDYGSMKVQNLISKGTSWPMTFYINYVPAPNNT